MIFFRGNSSRLQQFKADLRLYETPVIKKTLGIIILLIFLLVTTGDAYAAWYDSNWGYRKKITIQSSQVTAAQTNFPVLISTTDPDWKDVTNSGKVGQSDGGDILFTSSDGTIKLSHEIEIYTPSTGTLVAWVNVPSVSSSSNTEIYIYYGNAGAADQWETDGSTWDSNFLMVQHLQESPDDGVAGHIDSTSNAYNFKPSNFQDGGGTTDATGKIGGADNFAGDNDYLASSGFDSVFFEDYYPAAYTFSAWIKTSDIRTIFTEGRNSNVSFDTISLNASGGLHSRGHCTNWTSTHTVNSNATGLNDNTWRHIAIANNNGNMDVYIDGTFDNNYTYTPVTCSIAVSFSTIGSFRRNGNSGYWNGSIDEVRASKTKRSADWIATSYNNQNNPSSFYSAGGEENETNTRYWIGGSGSWSDNGNHWSTTSGGNAGATKPDPDSTVMFDANSGSGTCTLDENISIESFNMQTGNAMAVDSANYDITTSGNFIIAAGTFNANSSTINVGGNWDSSGGTWNRMTSTVNLTGTGTLKQYTASSSWSWGFNNLNVAASGQTTTLTSNNLWVSKLTVGSGTLTDGANSYSLYLQGTGDVFIDGGAAITIQNFYYRASNNTQNVVGRDYTGIGTLGFYGVGGSSGSSTYNVQENITANNINIWLNNASGNTRNSVLNTNNYSITANNLYIGRNGDTNDFGILNAGSSAIDINGDVIIYGSDANGTNEINADTSSWTVWGNWTNKDTFTAGTGSNMITLEPVSASTNWNLSPPAGTTVSGVDVSYSQSDKTITASNSNDGGNNNTNWVFGGVTRYWVAGGAGNWNDTANWSDASVGSGGYSVPGSGDTAVFDANGTGDCTISSAVTVGPITNTGGYTGTFTTSDNTLNVNGDFQWAAGTFDAGASAITVTGDWDSSGGTFTQGSSIVTFNGSSAQSITSGGDSFNAVTITNSSAGGVTFLDALTTNTLTDTTNGSTLKFATSGTHTINNTLTLTGGTGFNMITLEPATASTNWDLSPPAGTTVSGVDVSYSQSDKTITANNSNDGGNNTNWNFGTVTRYWVAGAGGNWSDTANWSDTSGGSGGYSVPGSGDTTVFDANGSGDCTMDITPTVSALTINGYAGTISTGTNGLTVSTMTLSSGTLTLGNQTTTVSGVLTLSGGTLSAGSGNIDAGNVTITSGTLRAPGSGNTFTVSGDWNNAGGTFNANGGSVTFDGTGTSIISGNSVFNNLTSETSAKQLTFQAGSNQTVSGTLTLTGDPGNLLRLRSSSPGSMWDITLSGDSQTVDFVDVQDSNAYTNTVTCINCRDSDNNNANWLFDPFGIVFDSVTNSPIKGAKVSLWYETRGGNWILAVPGIHIDAADENPQTTGPAGAYGYLTINGDFRFTVTAPGYAYPSIRSSFPAGRIICPGDPACSGQPGSRGERFMVSGAAIQMDHPMDANVNLTKVTKKANRKEANIGDIITYTITIESKTTTDLTNVYVTDRIPAGFKYIKDRTILDNQNIANPEGRRPITFNVDTLKAGQTRTLKYQLIVGSGVTFSKYENRVWARYSDGTVISNVAREEVRIIPDSLFDLGTVIGKVFLDRNENGAHDSSGFNSEEQSPVKEETGIAEVRIVTEEGTIITTDKDGKYHLAAVTPGRHILRIDERTLPEGFHLTTDKAVIIDITPGILQKINFGVNHTDNRAQNTEPRAQTTEPGALTRDNRQQTTERPDSSQPLKSDFFFVALADVKAGHTNADGNIEPAGDDDKFKRGFWSEGKLAYYLKGKIKGKYIITSSLDTDRERKELFKNLGPDKYYPVYGDASTVNYDAADTQGMLYLAIEWDKSKAMWGNYHTEITDTELARYNRTLYGVKFHYETVSTTRAGKPLTKLIIFQAEAKQKAAHNEFLGTGGSLYYLKHRPVVEGSDKVAIEIRDKNTGLVIVKIEQTEGDDYEIDYSNGRIILYQPVSQIAESNSIISTTILDGNPLYVVVDYEYEVNETDYNEWSYGGRVEQSLMGLINNIRTCSTNRQEITDNRGCGFIKDIRLGGTYIKETRNTGDYELKGIDTSFYLGENTLISGEYAESMAQSMDNFVSTDGGLSFTEIPIHDTANGKAYSLKAETGLYDRITLKGYYRKIKKGFSDLSTISEQGKESIGIDIGIDISQRTHLKVSHDTQKLIDEGNALSAQQTGAEQIDTSTAQITHDMDRLKLTGEYRLINVKEKTVSSGSESNEEGETAAVRADYGINKNLSVFLEQQATLRGKDNHQTSAGVSVKLFKWLNIKASETIGTNGNATSISTAAKVDDGTVLYNTYSLSNSHMDGRKTSIVTGSRKKITDKMDITAETQSSSSDAATSRTNILGLSGELNEKWGLSGSFQRGVVQSLSGSTSKRNAGSMGVSYVERERIKASSKIELRIDDGQENRRQYLSYNTVQWKADRNSTLFGKINFSESKNTTLDTTEARYKELVFGGAYRPVDFDRLNLFAKYTYLEDKTASGQSDMSDIKEQRAHVIAAEAVYDLTDKWQVVEKLALRQADEKVIGFDFTKTQTWLWINRVNYNLYRKWQVGAEYRVLRENQAKDMKQGALIEVARYIGKNIQIGVGYNFTDFNDDLTYLDYTSQGPFIRLSAKITD